MRGLVRGWRQDAVAAIQHQRRFFANARPEADFKYRSNSKACLPSLNAT
jgi:hypothetical protein